MKKNKTMIVVFLTPAVLLFLGIFLYPIIRTVIMSFFKIDGVTDSMDLWKFVGFGNYTKLMSTSLFKTSFFNLFRIWLIGGLVVMSLSLFICSYSYQWNQRKEIFPRDHLYAKYCQCSSACYYVATVCIQSKIWLVERSFYSTASGQSGKKIQFLDNDHKFWALLFAYCFWNGWIPYANLAQRY